MYGGRGTRGTLKDFWRYDIGKIDACSMTLCKAIPGSERERELARVAES